MIRKCCLILFSAAVIAGCRSDMYYQNRAAERARKFLLKNCHELTVDEMNYVKFNSPVLLHAPVLGSSLNTNTKEKLAGGLYQICVTWIIPGRKDLYMVFGVSGARMDGWQPNRILIRNYDTHLSATASILGTVRSYAQNNYFDEMSVSESNLVRFTFPYLIRTNIELNYDPENKLTPESLAELRQKSAGKIQYSLVWKFGNRNLVFAGLADKGLKNWNLYTAGFMSDEELKKYTVAVVQTPGEGLNPLPESEMHLPVKKAEEK